MSMAQARRAAEAAVHFRDEAFSAAEDVGPAEHDALKARIHAQGGDRDPFALLQSRLADSRVR